MARLSGWLGWDEGFDGGKAIRQGKDGRKGMAYNKGMKGHRKGGDRKGNRNATPNNAQS